MNKDNEEQLNKLNEFVKQYYKASLQDGDTLNHLLKKITATLYYLETVRSMVHDHFQKEIFEMVKAGESVARSENFAHTKFPEMYQLRRVMDAGYRIVDAIRSHISYLKMERETTKNQ